MYLLSDVTMFWILFLSAEVASCVDCGGLYRATGRSMAWRKCSRRGNRGQRSRPGYQVTLCLSPSLRYHGCHTVFFMDSGTVILCHKTVTWPGTVKWCHMTLDSQTVSQVRRRQCMQLNVLRNSKDCVCGRK